VQDVSRDLYVKQIELRQFRTSGICDGQLLAHNQLDGMLDRFDRLAVQLDHLQKKFAYEQLRNQLLIAISSAEARLKTWSAKFKGRDSVDVLVSDYEVKSRLHGSASCCNGHH